MEQEQTIGKTMSTGTAPKQAEDTAEEPSKWRTTLTRVVWMSIVLGLVMEAFLVAARLGMFSMDAATAELANRVSWAVLVCTGLAIGDTLAENSRPVLLGLSGLIGAPLAFAVARGVHKGTADIMGIAQPGDPISPLLAGGIRGVEYMVLGLAIFWLKKQPRLTVLSYIGVGLVIGLVFGSLIMFLNPGVTKSLSSILVWVVNEVAFPIGCTLVLFASTVIGEKVKA
jgi:hypothetical protein